MAYGYHRDESERYANEDKHDSARYNERIIQIVAARHSTEVTRYRDLNSLINKADTASYNYGNVRSATVYWQRLDWPRDEFEAMLAELKTEYETLGKFLAQAMLDAQGQATRELTEEDGIAR